MNDFIGLFSKYNELNIPKYYTSGANHSFAIENETCVLCLY